MYERGMFLATLQVRSPSGPTKGWLPTFGGTPSLSVKLRPVQEHYITETKDK